MTRRARAVRSLARFFFSSLLAAAFYFALLLPEALIGPVS